MSDNKTTHCHGFTLLELVLVICIIGILSQIGLSYMVNFQARAKDAIAIHDGRNLLTAVQTSFANRDVVNYEHAETDGPNIGAPTVFTLNPGVMAKITVGSKSDTNEGNGWFEAWVWHVNGTDDTAAAIAGKREFYYFIDESTNTYSLPSF